MKLDEVFERIVVINLPFKEDRRLRLKKHLRDIGIVDPKKVIWSKGICGDWTPPPSWWGAGNGAWGCLMSHLRIAQDAVQDAVESYCVLEDDVVFHPRAPEMLERFAKELPSIWGQAYLGGQFLHIEPERISPWVVRPYNVNRTHAFAVNKGTIPHFLQHIMNAPDYFNVKTSEQGVHTFEANCFHIDHQLGRAHEAKTWNTYAPTWWLAGQCAGSSNVSGRLNPELWWHWRDRGHQLPFFFFSGNTDRKLLKELSDKYLHAGYNLDADTLIDVGIKSELDDEALLYWLRMIAGEAVERWKLPGFEVPKEYANLPEQARRLWSPGVLEFDELLVKAISDYPFNGFCSNEPICYEL